MEYIGVKTNTFDPNFLGHPSRCPGECLFRFGVFLTPVMTSSQFRCAPGFLGLIKALYTLKMKLLRLTMHHRISVFLP